MATGVTTQKNSLGQLILICGLIILVDIMVTRRQEKTPAQKTLLRILYGMLLIGLWLLVTCQSRTSLLCLALGASLLFFSGYIARARHPKQVLVCCFIAVACLIGLDATLGVSKMAIEALGRNTTLTGRTDIWRVVKEQPINPVVGCGFLTFWDTGMGQAVVDELSDIKSSHNGYLEIYLDGGLIGVVLLGIMLLAAGRKTVAALVEGTTLGRLAFVIWIIALLYNFSESSFFRLGPLWLALLLAMIRCPAKLPQAVITAPAAFSPATP